VCLHRVGNTGARASASGRETEAVPQGACGTEALARSRGAEIAGAAVRRTAADARALPGELSSRAGACVAHAAWSSSARASLVCTQACPCRDRAGAETARASVVIHPRHDLLQHAHPPRRSAARACSHHTAHVLSANTAPSGVCKHRKVVGDSASSNNPRSSAAHATQRQPPRDALEPLYVCSVRTLACLLESAPATAGQEGYPFSRSALCRPPPGHAVCLESGASHGVQERALPWCAESRGCHHRCSIKAVTLPVVHNAGLPTAQLRVQHAGALKGTRC
jgi:hypothetical protein